MVTLVALIGSMPSVLRARCGRPDLHTPGGESGAEAVGDEEHRRVQQGNAIEREVVALRNLNETRVLLAAAGAGAVSQVPPRDVLAEHSFAAAPIDDAIAHDAGTGCVLGADERRAGALAVGSDGAAGSWNAVVIARVARGIKVGAAIDHQHDAFAQLQRAREKGVGAVGSTLQHDGLSGGAMVDGVLDTSGIGLALVASIDGGADTVQHGPEQGAWRRDDRLGDFARVLRQGG